MMRAEGTIIKEHVIIKVNLPLVSTQTSDIYRLTPIPFLAEGGISIHTSQYAYIAINSHRVEFAEMSEIDLKACQEKAKDDFICYNNQEMFSRKLAAKCRCFVIKRILFAN